MKQARSKAKKALEAVSSGAAHVESFTPQQSAAVSLATARLREVGIALLEAVPDFVAARKALPAKTHRPLEERTNPTWPTTWFAPRLTGRGPFGDTYSIMNNRGANHCVMSYGHIGADLDQPGQRPAHPRYMHNVERARVFRPSAWSAFGTDDLIGADFRACANFGPLY